MPKFNEAAFRTWYLRYATALGLNPNPDDPRHFYDWRAAYAAGAKPDETGHWPSKFKLEGHPRLILNGIDTRTGKAVTVPKKKETREQALARLKREAAGSTLYPGKGTSAKPTKPATGRYGVPQTTVDAAAARRAGYTSGLTGLQKLNEVLNQKPNSKRKP